MRSLSLSVLLFVLLVACSAGSPSPTSLPSPSPSASASPAVDFSLAVVPPEEPSAVRAAIPGEEVCLLVVVEDAAAGAGPVAITASATKATVREILPEVLAAGTVGEVWVVPDASSVEDTASVTITASRSGVQRTATRSIPIFPMVDERAKDAAPYFERWATWLAVEHPELGITSATEWEPRFVSTLLVVSHYAYWSKDWEMTVAWHNMIAPYDWTEVHLRHRGTESTPSLAFRIDSVSGDTAPHAVDPPEVAVR